MSEHLLPLKVGLVGCGDIARKAYLPFAVGHQQAYDIVSCFDQNEANAHSLANDFGIARVCGSLDEMLADPALEIILNLTAPSGHAPVNVASLRAGKHAFCEKPFALTLEEGREVLEAAAISNKMVGCAPDTVLGPGVQATRKLIEEGKVGRVLSAKIQCAGAGHEHWHQNPEFYYQKGGGPMLDMGPYYLSAIVHMLGPIKSVIGRAVCGLEERAIRCGEREGSVMKVEVPTLYVGSLETHGGVVVQVLFSFDHMYGGPDGAPIEIYGEKGAIRGTDPNYFEGVPELNNGYDTKNYEKCPVLSDRHWERGVGLVDMVESIRSGSSCRCDGSLAYHLLEVMLGFEKSELIGGQVMIESTCSQPIIMPTLD